MLNNEVFTTIVDEQIERCRSLLVEKGKEYALGKDRLKAFKQAAALQGCTSEEAVLGMLAKHIVSLSDMITSHAVFGIDRWNEKITDSINYLLILRAVIEEG